MVSALVAFVGIDARATYGARVSGDEPQYLLTATSIGEDGNLDIADEIAEGRYRTYHEVDLDPQTLVLDDTDRQISPHDALLPALLAVPMRVGGWAAAKALLVVIAGVCAAVTTWVAIRRVGLPAGPAAVGVTAAFVGLPLAAYGSQVYPEMPAALAVVAAVALLTSPAPTWWHDLGVLVALIVLPWLAVKYAPVVAVLGIALLLGHRHDTRRIAILAGGAAVAALAYVVAHRAWYGGWTVYASGDHFAETGELSVVGTKVNLLGRSRRLAGLLVDRDFGIAAWSPVWLLAPFGLGLLTARRWPGRWLVPAVITAGWLTATFVALTMHGFWVPGRQIVVVLPARRARPGRRCRPLGALADRHCGTRRRGALHVVLAGDRVLDGAADADLRLRVDSGLALPGDATPAAVRPRSDRRRPGAARRLGRPRPRHGLARVVPRIGQVEAGLGNLGAISAIRRSGRHFCQLLAEMAPRLARCRCLSTTSSSMRTIFPGSLGSGARCSTGRSCPSASGRS